MKWNRAIAATLAAAVTAGCVAYQDEYGDIHVHDAFCGHLHVHDAFCGHPHLHDAGCGHYYDDGHWGYVRGHRHGHGCGHHFRGGIWVGLH